MEQRDEVGNFLRTRRDRITPEQAGILGSTRRRVPGLRREEVAMIAGVSVEYYARMERGDLRGESLEVLDNLARALQRFIDAIAMPVWVRDRRMDFLAVKTRSASPESRLSA